jgi:hypothetical protein
LLAIIKNRSNELILNQTTIEDFIKKLKNNSNLCKNEEFNSLLFLAQLHTNFYEFRILTLTNLPAAVEKLKQTINFENFGNDLDVKEAISYYLSIMTQCVKVKCFGL